jgi:hypothetical protein
VCIRIQLSRATVKELHSRLQDAYRRDDMRLVRRTTVLIDLLVHHVPVAVLCERWDLSPACIYGWQKAFLLRGLDSLVYGHGGGRRPKLSHKQKQRLVELIDAGPLVAAQLRVFVSKGPFCLGSSRCRTAPTLAPAGMAQDSARRPAT